jgi:methylamine dehydrogenase accessory protein MauD
VLLLGFTAGIGVNLALGRTPDCHCFGALSRKPISVLSLVRNTCFLLIAGFIAVEAPSHAGGLEVTTWLASLGAAEVVGLLVAIVGLGMITFQWIFLFNLMTQNGRLISRLEALESQAGQTANDVVMGLPVGIPAPRFDLPDLFGDMVSIESLLAQARPVLLIFTHPDCGPCKAMLPDIAAWQRERWGEMTIALVSRGTVPENKAKADEHGLIRVLLQANNEVAEDYQAPGTPAGVLVNPDGTVGSPLALGAEAIRILVDNVGRESRPTSSPTIQLEDSAPRSTAIPQLGS